MVERTEATVEEIVGALRETRRGVGRPPPLAVVRGRGENDWTSYPAAVSNDGNESVGRGHAEAAGVSHEMASTDIAYLRDAEIERLLAENARCNERIMFLLKVIEHEQARTAAAASGTVSAEMDRAAILRDVKASVDAELRPILLVLQRLAQKNQQLRPAGENAGNPASKALRSTTPAQPSGWIADMSRKMGNGGEGSGGVGSADRDSADRDSADGGHDWKAPPTPAGVLQLPNFRQRLSRAFDALRV